MRHLLNTLFVTGEDVYLSLDNENVVINRNGTAIKKLPLRMFEQILYTLPENHPERQVQ